MYNERLFRNKNAVANRKLLQFDLKEEELMQTCSYLWVRSTFMINKKREKLLHVWF